MRDREHSRELSREERASSWAWRVQLWQGDGGVSSVGAGASMGQKGRLRTKWVPSGLEKVAARSQPR